MVAATVRENVLDVGSVEAGDDAPGVIYLATRNDAIQRAAGVARITVFDQKLNPLAERLVFRNRRARLDVKIEPDKKTYAPRGQVALAITTRDASGKAVPAELAVSVVDDTVVSFADDKSGHLLSQLLLEPELPGKVEEPNFYLDLTEAKSALALDLLMGTHGYRRFEWVAVLQPLSRSHAAMGIAGGMLAQDALQVERHALVPPPMPAPAAIAPRRAQPVAAPDASRAEFEAGRADARAGGTGPRREGWTLQRASRAAVAENAGENGGKGTSSRSTRILRAPRQRPPKRYRRRKYGHPSAYFPSLRSTQTTPLRATIIARRCFGRPRSRPITGAGRM